MPALFIFRIPSTDRSDSTMTDWPVYGKIDGPIVMIGFGSIGAARCR